MKSVLKGNLWVKSNNLRFSPQNQRATSDPGRNSVIRFLIGKATEIESFLQLIFLIPNNVYKVCVSFSTDCSKEQSHMFMRPVITLTRVHRST